MKDTKVVIFTVFKMKILYILFIGVCCAAIIATAKYLFSDIANRHGDYLFIRVCQEFCVNRFNKQHRIAA